MVIARAISALYGARILRKRLELLLNADKADRLLADFCKRLLGPTLNQYRSNDSVVVRILVQNKASKVSKGIAQNSP
jgi:hypothetical protein